jgi:UDP-2-acetamido-3-amino-2,3-dideoxy-glucuronate N-acetyltransferase
MKWFERLVLGLAMYVPIMPIKILLYRMVGARIGKGVYIAPNVVINCTNMKRVNIGDYCSLGLGVQIRCRGIKIDHSVKISGGVCIYGKEEVFMGPCVHIGQNAYLDCYEEIVLQKQVQIAPGAMILTHDSSQSYIGGEDVMSFKKVLKELSYIGAGAIVLPGVNIEKRAIIGAGAVVTRDVLEDTTVLGVPARSVKNRKESSMRT